MISVREKIKNIWIINEYAGSPYHGMIFRHYYLSKELIKYGYNVTIITASYSHFLNKLPQINGKFTLENIDGINYVWIKVPHYKNSQDKKRVLKWFLFTYSLFNLPLSKLYKPDVIIASPSETLPVYPSYKLSKKFKSKLIFEVRDIWPLTIIQLGGYSPNNPFIKILKYCEKIGIEKSDLIISVLPNYGDYLKSEGYNKNFVYLPNGINLEEFETVENLDRKFQEIIPLNKFIVGYTGKIGISNAVHYLVEAGKLLKQYKDISIIIVGDGSEKNKLVEQTKGYENIIFLPSLPKSQVQSILKKFNLCYIGLPKKSIFKFGVSPNKLFEYMYAGKPILYSIDSGISLVDKANCGLTIEPENPNSIVNGILRFYRMPENERIEMGKNGKNYVLENHTYEIIGKKLINIIENI